MNIIKDKWNGERLAIENIAGEYQISLSNMIKNSISIFNKKKYKKILDLGCGTGRNSLFFAQYGFEIFSSDIATESTDILKNKLHSKNVSNVHIYNFSFKDILFEDNFFDVVICTSVLHHGKFKDIERGVSEIYRVLKPDGCLICDMLSKDDLSYGLGEFIEENTFIGSREGEEGVLHHYTDLKELEKLFRRFNEMNTYKNEYIIDMLNGKEYCSRVFDIVAFK
ncbi:class I SAM-dependent methyltransferase [Tissierella pigra]|uniref:Class I SAM-dependent methyltransferase n=1 Tax=Tissierella pigra TaxID=2607614 RepID=A0A6N7XSG8_9FIRM|nr:class I SAM-dependent methyltransferase [Tissierella pigra]MSU00363.1 class I SAM-dependent methyltransferase [Tissierella pigra]